MLKVRVGVTRGGPSSEYDVSLKTGAAVLENLPDRYEPVDVLITKDGLWHMGGVPVSPTQVRRNVDVVFNALHGEYGEDGQIQKIFDSLNLPYTGSGQLASNLAMNKPTAKDLARRYAIQIPLHFLVKKEEGLDLDLVAREIFTKISPPWVIKPAARGSSIGLFLAPTFNQLATLIYHALQISEVVIVEEYILGKEATCGVIERFRGQSTYALPPIEIRTPKEKKLFDFEAKYSGQSEEICPGCFAFDEKKELEQLAVQIHQLLGLRHYSRSDFIVSKRGVYFLEVNTLPGLTEESLMPKAIKAVGSNYSQFLDHVIQLALRP